ncbi:MAG: Smr/MutS family protein [Myxococcota bacterium]
MAVLHPGKRPVLPMRVDLERPEVDPDDEAFEELCRFVRGEGVFDLADQDEFVEGARAGLDPRVMARLRAGEFSVQGYVDLHGRVVDEAYDELRGFLRRARLEARRCVLVVHGRGRHSKDRIPVLKEKVVQWLSRGAMSRQVLAFCTARSHDGGAGAMYVLLRRKGEELAVGNR